MHYNDYRLIGEREAMLISQEQSQVEIQRINDLKEIREKLNDQRNAIKQSNNSQIDNILNTIQQNIATLDRLINASNTNKKAPTLGTKLKTQQNANDPQVYGKIPSHNEIMRMESYNTNITTPSPTDSNISEANSGNKAPIIPISPHNNTNNNFIPGGTTNSSNNQTVNPPNAPTQREGRRINNRSYPLQGSILSTLTKAISMNFRNRSKRLEMVADTYRNRFHNITLQGYLYDDSRCDPHNKLITRQVDLMRLLILFITLQPHCIHTRPICGILNDQFDIFLQLMN